MEIIPVKRRRHGKYEDSAASRRQCTLCYTVPNGSGKHVQVCLKTFKGIFDLTARRVQTLSTKKKAGCVTYVDKRGKNPASQLHRKKFTDDHKSAVILHISGFPSEESHYGRSKSSKQYLSPDLNIHRLYLHFKTLNTNSPVTYKYYKSVFKSEFPNLAFARPRTDTCQVCDRLNAGIKGSSVPSEQNRKKVELQVHQKRAEIAQDTMRKNVCESQMPASDVCTIIMDLQQVLFTPTLTHSTMFYSRQLSNYNLCIHIGDNDDCYMCLWHEGIAGRGGNEVASCLFKVLTSQVTEKNKIQIWCDNCAGQNKNKMVLTMLILLVKNKIFKEISVKFLMSGHSFMACDRDFGLIEKRKRVTKCMVPEDLATMIKATRVNKPYKVIQMKPDDFYDFASLANRFINTNQLKISTASSMVIKEDRPTVILIKATFNDAVEASEINVLKRGSRLALLPSLEDIPRLCSSNKISEAKKNDLLAMCEFLNDGNKNFYIQLLSNVQ